MAGHGQFQVTRTHDESLTVDTDAYSANDVVGGLLTLNIAKSSGGGGLLRRIILVDDHNQSEPFTLYLFDATPTSFADDAAFAPTNADLEKLIGTVAITAGDYVTVNSNGYAIVDDIDLEFNPLDGNVYAYLVCGETPDYNAATDLHLRLFYWIN